jgi:Ca2+-transporting ATPase
LKEQSHVATGASETPDLNTAYRRPIGDVIRALATDLEQGLTEHGARSRLERHGRNELVADKAVPGWRRFLAQFRDVLVILLLVATGVSAGLWLFEGGAPMPYEAIAILAVVLLNAMMGFIQEARAEAAVAALRSMSAADATVIRGGDRRSLPAADIVPGDIILVEEGDTVPADARLIESIGLQTAEAALTGESLPITKDTTAIAEDVPLGDRENMIFSGTSVTYGHGKAIVTAPGCLPRWDASPGCCRRRLRSRLPFSGNLLAPGKFSARSSSLSPL